MTAREALIILKRLLESAGAPEAEAKAKVIIAHALDISYSDVYTDKNIPDEIYRDIQAMAQRCLTGEPVEYITGRAYFRYLTLEVNQSVLIPRKETELVAGRAIELIKQNSYASALDMCTGSGCIAISLATETGIHVTAADNSGSALGTAQRNAKVNGAENIMFVSSDMFSGIDCKFDIIVCNPPYVSEEEYEELQDSVRLYEPKAALIAGDGYDFYRRIANEAPQRMNAGGALVLETGASQAREVMELIKQRGLGRIECMKDYAGRDRIVCAVKE